MTKVTEEVEEKVRQHWLISFDTNLYVIYGKLFRDLFFVRKLCTYFIEYKFVSKHRQWWRKEGYFNEYRESGENSRKYRGGWCIWLRKANWNWKSRGFFPSFGWIRPPEIRMVDRRRRRKGTSETAIVTFVNSSKVDIFISRVIQINKTPGDSYFTSNIVKPPIIISYTW